MSKEAPFNLENRHRRIVAATYGEGDTQVTVYLTHGQHRLLAAIRDPNMPTSEDGIIRRRGRKIGRIPKTNNSSV